MIVANPRKVRLISDNEGKDDPVDAELLARLGRVDVKLLSPIQHRGEAAQADLAVIRDRLKAAVTLDKARRDTASEQRGETP